MATRPVFIADVEKSVVREPLVHFKWVPGMARSQSQKCIRSLHEAARADLGIKAILEISSKSEEEDGVALSAFNVLLSVDGIKRPLECVYQSSKVFQYGGPFHDLLDVKPKDAKRDERLRTSGPIRGFHFNHHNWELVPNTAFYDYLYIKALAEDGSLSRRLEGVDAFTDIAFNPAKSFSCQARSAAMFVVLNSTESIAEALSGPEAFLRYHNRSFEAPSGRGTLFQSD